MTYATDQHELFWPQILRGAAVLFCLLPATALALEGLPTDPVVEGLVAAELRAGPPVALAASDCARVRAG